MIKIILLCILCSLIIFIAYKISVYYKQRQMFFENLCEFCNYMQTEIGFLKTDISESINKFNNCFSKDFSKVLQLYLTTLRNSQNFYDDFTDSLSKLNLLKTNEKEKIYSFFNNLGKSSQQEQIAQIENFKNDFISELSCTKDDNKKYGAVSLKLGMLLSLAIFIIFI